MIQNLHTHTARCGHAVGTDREYVLSAIEGGFKTLGFSEHSPHIYPGGYISKSHMPVALLPDYTASIRRLAEEYSCQLQILLGSEIEYYPALFADSVNRLRDAGVDYLILGQHWVDNEVGHTYLGRPFDDPQTLKKYLRQAILGMDSGLMTYFCHPDVPNFTGSRQLFDETMHLLCREANEHSLPVEYNLWGIHKKGNYPCERFWRIAAEENCRVVLGVDAHDPAIFTNTALITKAESYIKSLGMELIEQLPIRSIQ